MRGIQNTEYRIQKREYFRIGPQAKESVSKVG